MTKDEALRMCLKYIETDAHERKYVRHAIKEALAQPEQEPVGWAEHGVINWLADKQFNHTSFLYATLPQRTWVGLTDEDIDQGLLRSDYALKTAEAWRAGVVFAMTKLKEKNNG